MILVFAGSACNKTGNPPAAADNSQKPNTQANSTANTGNSTASPGNSAGTGGSSANSSTTLTTTATDISGAYKATGTNEGGGGNYEADLIVTKRGDVYQFSWNSKGAKYDGVGVQNGNKVAVSFADGADGRGCGVVLYEINSDGSLNGKAGYWGTNTQETETAKRTSGTDLAGEYEAEGKNTEGDPYKAKLSVKQSGEGYLFDWSGSTSFKGFGIKQGDTVSVGFGGAKCSFVAYEVKSDGTLDGKWGGANSTSFGTETAKKK